ncbi:hypothetical protein [Mesorhizobium sp. B2-7-1]|uniref:hypothetical protein n=1 Tax=Mesorhizobium sp. B2-7-1 TaxID=2589909 RepID=UPI00112DE824|nr:hypothetical protein [Mesorhizobium sp. B2-7-1]TPJ46838.1 hypothetical protein FJ471_31380 [Mesorhizobium sp. B2-7-1]
MNSGIDHEHSAAIEMAARWLSQTSRERIGRPIVPALKSAFGLTTAEAVAAIREAASLRTGGANAAA